MSSSIDEGFHPQRIPPRDSPKRANFSPPKLIQHKKSSVPAPRSHPRIHYNESYSQSSSTAFHEARSAPDSDAVSAGPSIKGPVRRASFSALPAKSPAPSYPARSLDKIDKQQSALTASTAAVSPFRRRPSTASNPDPGSVPDRKAGWQGVDSSTSIYDDYGGRTRIRRQISAERVAAILRWMQGSLNLTLDSVIRLNLPSNSSSGSISSTTSSLQQQQQRQDQRILPSYLSRVAGSQLLSQTQSSQRTTADISRLPVEVLRDMRLCDQWTNGTLLSQVIAALPLENKAAVKQARLLSLVLHRNENDCYCCCRWICRRGGGAATCTRGWIQGRRCCCSTGPRSP